MTKFWNICSKIWDVYCAAIPLVLLGLIIYHTWWGSIIRAICWFVALLIIVFLDKLDAIQKAIESKKCECNKSCTKE